MKKILMICHGNICRSPMAEFILKYLIKESGRGNDFYVESASDSVPALFSLSASARSATVEAGRGENVESGVMFMSCHINYNAPEPMRIWKTGDVFVNFSPTKTKDRTLEPGPVTVTVR